MHHRDLLLGLADRGLLDYEEAQAVLAREEHFRKTPEQALQDSGLVGARAIAEVLAELHGLPFLSLAERPIACDLLGTIPREIALHHCVVPLALQDSTLTVAMTAASLLGVLAQRLARRICSHCKEEEPEGVSRC